MRYLLDSNTCIEHLRRRGSRALKRRLLTLDSSDAAISVITAFELRVGAARQNAPADEQAVIEEFLARSIMIDLDEPSATRAVQLQLELRGNGIQIGVFDALIAGTALRHDLVLVTHNIQEFRRVRDLRLEDWQA